MKKAAHSKIAERAQKPVSPKLDPKHEIKCAYFNRRWDEETFGHLAPRGLERIKERF